jgi:hypothetical protein
MNDVSSSISNPAPSSTSGASSIDAGERRRVWIVIALLLLLLALPYAWSASIAAPGFEYSGLLYNPDDQNVHLAWARQARDGQFFFKDPFTHESLTNQRPLFTNLFSAAMGWISALTRLPLVWVYHGLRLLFAALAMWWFYRLCSALTDDKRTRLLALLLVAFSGGAGWLQPLLPGRVFIDRPEGSLMMPEAFTFTSALIFPLYIASIALLPFIYWQTLRAQESGNLRYAIGAGLAAMLLANIHTYDVLPLNVVLLLWALASTRLVRNSNEKRTSAWLAPLIVVAFTLPPLLYQYFVFKNSEEFRVKALTQTAAPPFLDIFLSFASLMLLAVLGGITLWRSASHSEQQRRAVLLMSAWAVVTLMFTYAPVSFARKMIEGFHLPLCFLAAAGLATLLSRIAFASTRKLVAGGVVALLSLSSLQFAAWCLGNAQDNNRARANVLMPPLYLAPGDAAALRHLNTAPATRERAVLCLTFLGNYVPRETGRTVYLGHWAETLHYGEKLGQVTRFFGIGGQGQMTADQAQTWLRENRIGIVVIGSYEQQLGATLPLGLPVLHQESGTTVYAVP